MENSARRTWLLSSRTVTWTRAGVPAASDTTTVGGVLSTSKGALSLSPVRASASGLLGASVPVTRIT
jgi:hypothetical protein